MNNTKLTLEQFISFKNKCQSIGKEFMQLYEENKDNPNFDAEKTELQYINKYVEIQNELLSCDLSDIPFEAWQDLPIISDETHIADFSKTKANIDFSIMELDYYDNCNFRGCNVKNLEKLRENLNPKYFDEQTIQKNSSLFLSDLFSDELKEKYYKNKLSIDDVVSLSTGQIEELKEKNVESHFDYNNCNSLMYETLGLDKIIELYTYSQEEYQVVNKILSNSSFGYSGDLGYSIYVGDFIEQMKNANIQDMKNICYSYARSNLLTSKDREIKLDELPELFVRENSDILLTAPTVPQDLRERYYARKLTFEDVINNMDLFDNIPIEYCMEYNYGVNSLSNAFRYGDFQKVLKKHPDVIKHIISNGNHYKFIKFLNENANLEENFTQAVKQYFLRYGNSDDFIVINEGQTIYNVPEWLSSMNFSFVDKIDTLEGLMKYNSSTFVLDGNQQRVIDLLNIDNIRRFEQETGFFSHKKYDYSFDLEMFNAFVSYFKRDYSNLSGKKIDFKDGTLSYKEFVEEFASCLAVMRENNIFADYPDYDWMQGEFRDKHPQIFMDITAPEELKSAFYKNKIDPVFIYLHKEYIPYLLNKNLSNIINADIKLNVPSLSGENGTILFTSVNFIDEYTTRYGNEKFLKLILKYGGVALTNIEVASFKDEIDNEQAIEKALRDSIYSKIVNEKMLLYSNLASVPEFISEHPEIFVNFESLSNIPPEKRENLQSAFYSRSLTFDDIKKYPELITILKDKNLQIAFGLLKRSNSNGRISRPRNLFELPRDDSSQKEYSDLELLEAVGNEKFLELCSKYGRYMNDVTKHLNKDIMIKNTLSFEDISRRIEAIIIRESLLGNLPYQPDDTPRFLREKHPELFLEEDAPEELKNYFYNYTNSNCLLTFKVLQQHKDWLPYLKGKTVSTSLIRQSYLKEDMKEFFLVFGQENALKLGINRTETVTEMMKAHKVGLMKMWYDKTGQKFIPDFVIMQNFNFEEADKFLVSGANWSNLMKIKNFSSSPESRDAMLKLAYSFGAFDQDQKGLKKLQELLTNLPKNISPELNYVIKNIDKEINSYNQSDIEFISDYGLTNDIVDKLKSSLKEEKVGIDLNKNIFGQIYRKNDDESYTLTINPQSYPKSCEVIRNILQNYRNLPILTPNRAHQLFGGFELRYDADFREFLLANMDKILENPEYASFVAGVQKQFSDIKSVNSNRTLTLELAISYLQSNKYTSVNVGNERVAEVSAIAGYSQSDFNTLQQIYNYGKQRTFSSIPRIKQNSGKYTYEMLRLDDPLAMAIGTLTDCCQELGDCAEVCMEHSMVDKNGRVFVIKDEEENIVAQSWVWRNKDVLCFDNIEIPDKAFTRAMKENKELRRKGFTTEVYDIYKQAAHDLIEADKKVYEELLESGKITQEQYDGLRLGKVTVGLGFNDIAEVLKQNSFVDQGITTRPLPFKEPVKLSRGLYTSDSITQYVLEERQDRKEYDGKTLPVHSDTYVEYSDSNFTEKSLLSLEKLEIVTKEEPHNLETSVGEYADSEHLVTEIARNYGLNPETTRIIMNPNFAIIYDANNNKLRIGDLLFNTRVENGQQEMDIENKVVIQMRLALDQIGSDKEIDISGLNEKQKEMYAKVTGLTEEIDIERGVSHAR